MCRNASVPGTSTKWGTPPTAPSLKCWGTGLWGTILKRNPSPSPGSFCPMKNGWASTRTGCISPASKGTGTPPRIPIPTIAGSIWGWILPISSIWIRSTIGGAPQASPVPAARIRRSSMTPASPSAARIVIPPAPAANIWRSGTTCSWNTTKRRTAPLSPCPRRTWIRAWAWTVPSPLYRGWKASTIPTPLPASSRPLPRAAARPTARMRRPPGPSASWRITSVAPPLCWAIPGA